MSGTGKSAALAELARRGFRVVDTDEPGWYVWNGTENVWDEGKVGALLDDVADVVLSGCVSNQRRFYDRFDAVVLLSAPEEVILERVASRTTNDYGKAPAERDEILANLREVEPLLRATCTHELDAARPLAEVVADLAAIVASRRGA
jgi:adenylate kinase family enzyme